MTNLLSELDAVLIQWDDMGKAYDFLRTHHAEITAVVRDAARYRHIRLRLWPGEVEDAVDIYPGAAALDLAVCEDHGKQIDDAIDAAMSAREGQG